MVTTRAAEAIRTIVSSSPVEGGGLKISARPVDETRATLELSLAEGPTPTDDVVEEHGSRVFVDQTVAAYLDDKVLDAQMEGGEVRFSIQEQQGAAGGAPAPDAP